MTKKISRLSFPILMTLGILATCIPAGLALGQHINQFRNDTSDPSRVKVEEFTPEEAVFLANFYPEALTQDSQTNGTPYYSCSASVPGPGTSYFGPPLIENNLPLACIPTVLNPTTGYLPSVVVDMVWKWDYVAQVYRPVTFTTTTVNPACGTQVVISRQFNTTALYNMAGSGYYQCSTFIYSQNVWNAAQTSTNPSVANALYQQYYGVRSTYFHVNWYTVWQ